MIIEQATKPRIKITETPKSFFFLQQTGPHQLETIYVDKSTLLPFIRALLPDGWELKEKEKAE